MEGDARLAAMRAELERTTSVQPHERDALVGTAGFSDVNTVFTMLARVEVLSSRLHRELVEWHTRFPEKPTLSESDAFWSDLKELRAAKEQLAVALDAIRARERTQPTLRAQLERATHEVGDVERYCNSYLDRVNQR